MLIKDISGVILAGGANKRFGGITKSTMLLNGKSIMRRMSDVLERIFEEIIIVTNTPDEFKEFNTHIIVKDIITGMGPLGGLYSGLKASSKGSVFIFAGDMPFIEKELISEMISEFINEDLDAMVPCIDKHPEPLHSIYRKTIEDHLKHFICENDKLSVRNFLSSIKVKYRELPDTKDNRLIFANINTPEDLAFFENQEGVR